MSKSIDIGNGLYYQTTKTANDIRFTLKTIEGHNFVCWVRVPNTKDPEDLRVSFEEVHLMDPAQRQAALDWKDEMVAEHAV